MTKGDRERLTHICRHCRDIEEFIERFGNDYNVFINDRAYVNAVCMSVLQIGELANGLSEEFREETKNQMPWGLVRGMRNWLAHAYSSVDESIIWETASNDIPSLLEFCSKQLEKE